MEENVDAVILEVGVGGEYDATNVIESPIVCGITSLGMDHIAVLGSTIEKIAWHKAGIIKVSYFNQENVPVFSVPQPGNSDTIIQDRAKEVKAKSCTILTSKDIENVTHYKLGLAGAHQNVNAALAHHLCTEWAKVQRENGVEVIGDVKENIKGLEQAFWPGRCQSLLSSKYPNSMWYLDGAHTAESLLVCAEWYLDIVLSDSNKTNSLIFNCTHGRLATALLPPLVETFSKANIKFKDIIFTTNEPWNDPSAHSGGDLVNNTVSFDASLPIQNELAVHFRTIANDFGFHFDTVKVVPNTEKALEYASASDRVLITGSLHLVGSCLTVFETPVL
jgi:folylpolyglutamate synthase